MLSVQEILKPEILRIAGCNYRKLPYENQHKNIIQQEEEEMAPYVEEDDYYYYDEPESCVNEYTTIEKTQNGYRDVIKDIPAYYFRFIVGKGAVTKQRIESQTKTKLSLPTRGSDGDIVISGKERSGVIASRNKIMNLIDLNRRDQPAVHFLSVQLITDEIRQKFHEFKKEVLQMKGQRGVEESIFQYAERLHLTICLIIFLNKNELDESMTQIQNMTNDLKTKYFGDDKIRLHLHGIEYMNDDPGEVDVLYAKVKLTNDKQQQSNLQDFIDELVQALISEGYVKKQYDHIKLHATIMNTLFRPDANTQQTTAGYDRFRKKRETFDARQILKRFTDFDFGELTLQQFDVSIRSKFDKNGNYVNDGVLTL